MEWVEKVLIAVISGGGALALAKAYIVVSGHRHKIGREDRGDEIDVLHGTIADLRKEKEECKSEGDAARKALSDLRSEHTACLMKQQEVRAENRWYREKIQALEERVKYLEDQLKG